MNCLMMLKKNDFVVLTKKHKDISKNSVGLIKDIGKGFVNVFFIGKGVQLKVKDIYIKFFDVTRTGKPYKYKICNICHILKKDMEDFDVNQTDAKGRKTTRPSCKECRKVIDGCKLLTEEKKKLEQVKPQFFFVCPICDKASIPGVTANLVKDHDHSTGRAREWICDSCNTGLGRFKDDIKLLERAIKYLIKHSK